MPSSPSSLTDGHEAAAGLVNAALVGFNNNVFAHSRWSFFGQNFARLAFVSANFRTKAAENVFDCSGLDGDQCQLLWCSLVVRA
jgi:hypothetical protein